MKSIAELDAIRDKTLALGNLSPERKGVRVVVGMASCGIAAGARPVLHAFEEEARKHGLKDVTIVQTGCIGMCRLEPLAEVTCPGQDKMTYVAVTADMVPRIVEEHIIGGKPVSEYTVGAAEA